MSKGSIFIHRMTWSIQFALWPLSPLCQNFWDIAGIAPAGDCSGDLCLRGHLGISCMPPTASNSPCSNRPPANYGFPRSLSSWNHYRIGQRYEMFSFAPSSLVQLTGDFASKTNSQKVPRQSEQSVFDKISYHTAMNKLEVKYLMKL